MKHRLNAIAIVAVGLLLCAAARGATLTNAVTCPIEKGISQQIAVRQGETRVFEVQYTTAGAIYDLSWATSAKFYWQTNGMGRTYWSSPVEIVPASGISRVTWTSGMDCGADRYTGYVGLWQGTNPLYPCVINVLMQTTPGYVPNAIALPTRVLDFNTVAWSNAPWVTATALQVASNALSAAISAALQIASTNMAAALSVLETADRDYAAAVAASAAGATNAAHLAAVDPHGDRAAAAATLGASGTLWRAESATTALSLASGLLQTGTVLRSLWTTRMGTSTNYFEHDASGSWEVTISTTSNLVVISTSGDGYNGPALGTVWTDPQWIDEPARWTWVSGDWTIDNLEGQWICRIIGEEFEFDGYGQSTPAMLSAGFADAVGSFTVDFLKITNRVRMATAIMLTDHNADSSSHPDLRAAIAGKTPWPTWDDVFQTNIMFKASGGVLSMYVAEVQQ